MRESSQRGRSGTHGCEASHRELINGTTNDKVGMYFSCHLLSSVLQLNVHLAGTFYEYKTPPSLHTMPAKRQKVNETNNMAHAFLDLPVALQAALPKANQAAENDEQLKYFTTSNAIAGPARFGIKAAGSDNAIVVTVTNGKADIRSGTTKVSLMESLSLKHWTKSCFHRTASSYYLLYHSNGRNS